MALFKKGVSGNPEGRRAGSRKPNAAGVVAQCEKYLAPYSGELIERAVESALTGDHASLAAALNMYAAALNAVAAQLQVKLAKRPNAKAALEVTAATALDACPAIIKKEP